MAYHSLADIFAANEAAQSRFETAVSNLSEAQANFRPADDQWTIAELAEHVSITHHAFLRITNKLLKQAEEAQKPPRTEFDYGHTSLTEQGHQHGQKLNAPDRVKPQGGVSIDSALQKMRATIAEFTALRGRIEGTDLTDELFPHLALGEINAYRWMILMSEHQNRHRLQIERVKADAGYPS